MTPYRRPKLTPLELTLPDGAVVTNQFFLFVAGDRADGIAPEASNVVPKHIGGQFVYYTCPSRPEIAWRAASVEGRQIWVDRYLPGEIFISDALEARFRALGFAHYETATAPVLAG